MARKSVFHGGAKDGLSVQQVIDCGSSSYIAYSYFRYNNISYLDEILDELKISEEFRIAKPGSDLELYEKYRDHYWGNLTDIERMAASQRSKSVFNKRAKRIEYGINRTFKEEMRSWNQKPKHNRDYR